MLFARCGRNFNTVFSVHGYSQAPLEALKEPMDLSHHTWLSARRAFNGAYLYACSDR